MNDPATLPRTCTRCLENEGDPKLDPTCKHRFVRHVGWLGLVSTDLWSDVKSESTAMRLLGELCFDASFYECVRRLTDEEARMLAAGLLRPVIRLEIVQPPDEVSNV
jgi:hypothetical protein